MSDHNKAFEQALAVYEQRRMYGAIGPKDVDEIKRARAALVAIATRGTDDAARVDWLEKWKDGYANIDRITSVYRKFNGHQTLRAAIDAALAQPSEPNSCPKCCRPDNEPCPRPYCWRAHDAALAQPSDAGKATCNSWCGDAACADRCKHFHPPAAPSDAGKCSMCDGDKWLHTPDVPCPQCNSAAAPSAEDDAGLIAEAEYAEHCLDPDSRWLKLIRSLRARLSRPQSEGADAMRELCAITAWNTGMDRHRQRAGIPDDCREVGSACARAIRDAALAQPSDAGKEKL